MRVIEAISNNGMRSSTYDHGRATTPHPGDHVRWEDGTLGRIERVGTGFCEPDEAHVCENQGSAFMHDDGELSISGGPFKIVKLADLHETMNLELSRFWNWGDKRPSAGMACEFMLVRPVFEHRTGAGAVPVTPPESAIEKLLTDWFNAAFSVISERGGSWDWQPLIDDAKARHEALGIPWRSTFVPDYVRNILALDGDDA